MANSARLEIETDNGPVVISLDSESAAAAAQVMEARGELQARAVLKGMHPESGLLRGSKIS